MADSADVLIVGAGVVGLACARAAAQRGLNVVLVERHAHTGEETSSRNSGVIHSGIYYPTGSLKARLCVEGRLQLYAYCETRGIAYRRCGKLVVAQHGETDALDSLHLRARENGIADVERLSGAAAQILEPAVHCAAALCVTSAGIVDVHEYMLALHADIEAAGGIVSFKTDFEGATPENGSLVARLRSAGEAMALRCRFLVNAAGLHAVGLLARIESYPQAHGHRTFLAKGSYFGCRGFKPFRHLVYPMPTEASLGLHATLDLDGSTRFGPDVEWVEKLDYQVDAARAERFYAAIRGYWPALPDGALQPAYAGIRPKRVGPGEPAADFLIEGPAVHGVPGLVNLIGIDSPGLTSSLAIGAEVASRLEA